MSAAASQVHLPPPAGQYELPPRDLTNRPLLRGDERASFSREPLFQKVTTVRRGFRKLLSALAVNDTISPNLRSSPNLGRVGSAYQHFDTAGQ